MRKVLFVSLLVACFCVLGSEPAAASVPYAQGDVFAGVGDGKINHYGPTGTLKEVLDTGTGVTDPPGDETGMCFDPTGKLYTTDYTAVDMAKFNNQGGLITYPFGPTFEYPPENCAVDQAGQIVYVGLNEGDNEIFKLDTNGNVLDIFFVELGSFGISAMDLAQDGCTVDYTSEGAGVKRFDVCTNTQLSDLAGGLPGPCYGLRIRSNGELIVACDTQIVRVSAAGSIIQTYNPGSQSDWFAVSLDPDGTSFWAASYTNGNIYKVNIASGSVSTTFAATPATGAGLAGLAVFGDGAAQPGYPRPKGATPLRTSLAVAYKQCTNSPAPTRQHGGPLNGLSCNPPVQSSNFLTVGTGDAWPGTTPNASGLIRYDVKSNTPEDVKINTNITDVRCKSSSSVAGLCGVANDTPQPDYTGEVQATTTLRIVDRFNSAEPATQPFNDPGTTADTPFPVSVPCASTSITTIGSTCSLVTTANAVAPGALTDNMKTIWQFGQTLVFDGGSDGVASTSGNTLFMDQGVFVP
jgi:hypothetical protein